MEGVTKGKNEGDRGMYTYIFINIYTYISINFKYLHLRLSRQIVNK